MSAPVVSLGIEIIGLDDCDRQEMAQLGRRLRSELLETDATSVDEVRVSEAPPGTKGFEIVALGSLVLQIVHSVGGLGGVVGVVRDYVARQPVRSVKITIDDDVLELTAASPEEQRRLIDAWLSRHPQLDAPQA
jgi:hypothetical protein